MITALLPIEIDPVATISKFSALPNAFKFTLLPIDKLPLKNMRTVGPLAESVVLLATVPLLN
ncbi:MAG: hypothetical protein U5L01_14140 [Rheinheimera sp.]|nr:hypothetical protein [Rheinheimera sp.]